MSRSRTEKELSRASRRGAAFNNIEDWLNPGEKRSCLLSLAQKFRHQTYQDGERDSDRCLDRAMQSVRPWSIVIREESDSAHKTSQVGRTLQPQEVAQEHGH